MRTSSTTAWSGSAPDASSGVTTLTMSGIRTTLITGGNSGIGEALAKNLVERGQRVVSVGLEKPAWTHDLLAAYCADLIVLIQSGDVRCQKHELMYGLPSSG